MYDDFTSFSDLLNKPSHKIVVYTCITGEYDILKPIKVMSPNVDYICFTDNKNLRSPQWKIRDIPEELKYQSTIKKQRLIKILPNRYLSEYDISIWIDGNMQIIDDVNKFIKKYDLSKYSMYTNKHPIRTDIYQELLAVIKLNKEDFFSANAQVDQYYKDGYPKNSGLIESNVILRKHNEKDYIDLAYLWSEHLIKGSYRDQLSFNYCAWKLNYKYGLLNESYFGDGIFRISKHSKLIIADKNDDPYLDMDKLNHEVSEEIEHKKINNKINHLEKENIKVDNSQNKMILDIMGKLEDLNKKISNISDKYSKENEENLKIITDLKNDLNKKIEKIDNNSTSVIDKYQTDFLKKMVESSETINQKIHQISEDFNEKNKKDELEIKELKEEIKEIISKNKSKNKIVVYTCITGNYDSLKPIFIKSENIDYICFTDSKIKTTFGWKILPIPSILNKFSDVKKQRLIKILPHIFLKNYDISLWIDGVYALVGDIDKLINRTLRDAKSDTSVFVRKHRERDSIYDEALACIKENKVDEKLANQQVHKYRLENFPDHYGLTETNIILRKHNDKDCIELMELWAKELIEFTHRDQLSFDYCRWKLNFTKIEEFYIVRNNLTNGFIEKSGRHKSKVGIYITNHNTSKLVNSLIRSIYSNVNSISYHIFVLDNSDIEQFKLDDDIKDLNLKITCLDNMNMQLVNTNKYVEEYSKVPSKNNYASFRHTIAIQWILDNTEFDNILLLDSDVIIKRDIDFIDSKFYTIADTEYNGHVNRFCPFIQYFNVKLLRQKNIRYLDVDRIHGGSNYINSGKYDTGASFYEDILKNHCSYRKINHNVYVNHLRGGSWKGKDVDEFIRDNKIYCEV